MWPGLTASDLGNILKIMKSGLLFGADVGHREASGAENRALRGDGDESGQGAGTLGMCRVSPGRRREEWVHIGGGAAERPLGRTGAQGSVSWPLWLQWGCVWMEPEGLQPWRQVELPEPLLSFPSPDIRGIASEV